MVEKGKEMGRGEKRAGHDEEMNKWLNKEKFKVGNFEGKAIERALDWKDKDGVPKIDRRADNVSL